MVQIGLIALQCVLCDLVPFAQFKKCEKLPWMSVTFSKVAGFTFTQNNTPPTQDVN